MELVVRVATSQVCPCPGNVTKNLQQMLCALRKAQEQNCELLVFPRWPLTGTCHPSWLEDFGFFQSHQKAFTQLLSESSGKNTAMVFSTLGFCLPGHSPFERVFLVHDGSVCLTDPRSLLFSRGEMVAHVQVRNEAPAIVFSPPPYPLANLEITLAAKKYGGGLPQLPSWWNPETSGLPLPRVFANLGGGAEEGVFTGMSMVQDSSGEVLACAKPFVEDFLVSEVFVEPLSTLQAKLRGDGSSCGACAPPQLLQLPPFPRPEKRENVPAFSGMAKLPDCVEGFQFSALVRGIRDFVVHSGFQRVVLGLSGGIDSALVATLATFALGKQNVFGLLMPSTFSSPGSVSDALHLAENLGIRTFTLPIASVLEEYHQALLPAFSVEAFSLTQQNLQARIRGNLLMAFANYHQCLVLATGNKSEVAMGYSTLYGDTVGALAPLKDLFKGQVYRLARYANKVGKGDWIPENTFQKAPSAELAPGQKDEDSLPPYTILDEILGHVLDQGWDRLQLLHRGYEEEVVDKVLGLLRKNEFKRRQGPPGIPVSGSSFDRSHVFSLLVPPEM